MIKRNRAEGWKHAKLSGHENEQLVSHLFDNENQFYLNFIRKLGKENCKIIKVEVGGLNEKNVESVLGKTTKSKTDLKIFLNDGSIFKISIKKSLSGQVYLLPIHHFIEGFEKQFCEVIPHNVKKAIELYWGSSDETLEIVNKFGTQKYYETRKHRAVADTIYNYNPTLHHDLLEWFKTNTSKLFDFCFSRGLSKNEDDWANVIWYKNELGESSLDEIILVDDIKKKLLDLDDESTFFSKKNGGSTIQLAFGFVQWHSPLKTIPGSVQFHHNYKKLIKLKNRKKWHTCHFFSILLKNFSTSFANAIDNNGGTAFPISKCFIVVDP